MDTSMPERRYPLWGRTRELAAPILVWAVWGAMTLATILLIRQHTRNVPYMDDFGLVSMMTGHEPVSLAWIWAQHNEHRPVISRLILVGLSRFVDNDFRAGMYVNAGLMSAAAVSMLLLARSLRGHTSVTDAVLPLSILNLGQAETLLISFAMNLVLTAWISCALIATVDQAGRRPGWLQALKFGLLLVLLPLCGGSGLVMLPALVLWFAGEIAWGWWSGKEPGYTARAIGLALLMACSAVVTLYLSGYVKPAHHPSAPSPMAATIVTVEYLSLVVCPNVPSYWWPVGLTVLLLVTATLMRLAMVGLRMPAERPRAFGLIAVILSLLGVAAAVGLSRSGIGPRCGLASRYVTIAAPMLSALYIAWLAYGPAPARRLIHLGLLALVCLAVPANVNCSLKIASERQSIHLKLEECLKARKPASQWMSQVSPALYPDLDFAYTSFKMLKSSNFGKFKFFNDDRVTAAPDVPAVVR